LQEVAYSQFLKQEEQKVAEDNQEEA